MKSNNLIYLITVVILLSVGLSFSSCSSDHNDDEVLPSSNDNHLIVNSERINAHSSSNFDGATLHIEYWKSEKTLSIFSDFYLGGYANGKSRGFGFNFFDIEINDLPIGVNLIDETSTIRCSVYYSNITWARTIWREKGIGEIILKEKDMKNHILTFEFKNVKFDDTPESSGDGMMTISGYIKTEIDYLK